jgi:hypothetical protein
VWSKNSGICRERAWLCSCCNQPVVMLPTGLSQLTADIEVESGLVDEGDDDWAFDDQELDAADREQKHLQVLPLQRRSRCCSQLSRQLLMRSAWLFVDGSKHNLCRLSKLQSGSSSSRRSGAHRRSCRRRPTSWGTAGCTQCLAAGGTASRHAPQVSAAHHHWHISSSHLQLSAVNGGALRHILPGYMWAHSKGGSCGCSGCAV